RLDDLVGPADVEVVLLARTDLMALAQERRDLVDRGIDGLGRGRGSDDVVEPRLVAAADLLLRGAPGKQDGVVLILPGERLPLGREEAHDHHELGIDATQLPNGAGLSEQLSPHRLSDDADGRGPADVFVGERSTPGEWPAFDGQVSGPDSDEDVRRLSSV